MDDILGVRRRPELDQVAFGLCPSGIGRLHSAL